MSSLLNNIRAAVGIARRMCKRKDVTLDMTLPEGQAPHTDGTRIRTQRPAAGWSQRRLDDWIGTIRHETNHCSELGMTGFTVLKRLAAEGWKDGLPLHTHNLFEDIRVDTNEWGQFPGWDQKLIMSKLTPINNLIDKGFWRGEIEEKGEYAIRTCALIDCYVRQSYMRDLGGIWNDIYKDPEAAPKVKEYFDKAMKLGYDDKLMDAIEKGAEAVWEYTLDILKNVFDFTDDEIEESQDESEEQGGEGEPCDEGEEGEDAEGEDTEEKGEVSKKKRTIKYKPLPYVNDPLEYQSPKAALTIEYDDFVPEGYRPYGPEEILVVDYALNKVHGGDGLEREHLEPSRISILKGDPRYFLTRTEDKHTSDRLTSAVQRNLQSEARLRVDVNQKKGKMDTRRIHKLAAKGVSADYQSRIFWRKEHKVSHKATDVALLCDGSGSMYMDKAVIAHAAGRMMGGVLSALGVNFELAGFTTGMSCVHYLYKKFGDKYDERQVMENQAKSCEYMNGNADGDSILFEAHRLLNQKGKRKILIILSDGQPSGGSGDIFTFTKEVIKEIEERSPIEIYGIGIMDDGVRLLYKDCEVLQSTSELEPALLKLITKKLKVRG